MNESKNILKSKTFWFNILGAVAEYSGALQYVGVPPGAALVVSNLANVALRTITNKPVTILPK